MRASGGINAAMKIEKLYSLPRFCWEAALRMWSKGSVILFVAVAMAFSLSIGADVNWDLQNYHFYAPYALTNWRYDLDLVPAGLQSYFNPLLDLPYYFTVRYAGIAPAAMLLAAFYGVFAWLVWRLNSRLFALEPFAAWHSSSKLRLLLPLFATALGVTGVAGVSQIGTTFNEVQTAALLLAGLVAVVRAWSDEGPSRSGALAAGVLFGAAAALKLTAATFAPALVLASLATAPSYRGIQAAIWICIGWCATFALLFGWWGAVLYSLFENPVFPFYNAIFRSPWFPPVNFRDMRFLPTSMGEWVTYPFSWAFRPSTNVSEMPMADPRLAISLVALLVLVVLRCAGLRLPRPAMFVVTFFALSYIIWLVQFSILRYAMPLEALGGTVVVMAAALLTRSPAARGSWLPAIGLAAGFVITVQLTQYPSWGRTDFSRRFHSVDSATVVDGSLIVVQGQPLGFVIPFVTGKNLRFVGISEVTKLSRGYRLYSRTIDTVLNHTGPLAILRRVGDPSPLELPELGMTVDPTSCRTLDTTFENGQSDIELCGATSGSPAT